jgi:hypothetical protein
MRAMAKNRIRIIVEGDPQDSGHVRLSDLLKQLDSVRNALKQTERIMGEHDHASVYYRVIDASYKSPLTMVLEAVDGERPARARAVVKKFLSSASQIRRRGTIPHDFDYPAAEAYREIVAPQHKHIRKLVLANGRRQIVIDKKYEQKIVHAIGPDELAEGSIAGTLDTVKLHNTTAFEIFPTIGPKKVACHFGPELKERVKQGLERYVRVYGRLRYKHWDKFPYAINATDIEIYPPDDELPTLTEIRGMAPDLTNGLNEHEFLEKVRDAWEA